MLGLLLRGAFVLAAAATVAAVIYTIFYLDEEEIKGINQKQQFALGSIVKDIVKSGDYTKVTLESLDSDETVEVHAQYTADLYEGQIVI